MTTFIVSYDLRKPEKDYKALHEALKKFPKWCHVLESFWVIVSNSSANEVRDVLVQHVDTNDQLIVVKSANVGAWRRLSDSIANWLRQNL